MDERGSQSARLRGTRSQRSLCGECCTGASPFHHRSEVSRTESCSALEVSEGIEKEPRARRKRRRVAAEFAPWQWRSASLLREGRGKVESEEDGLRMRKDPRVKHMIWHGFDCLYNVSKLSEKRNIDIKLKIQQSQIEFGNGIAFPTVARNKPFPEAAISPANPFFPLVINKQHPVPIIPHPVFTDSQQLPLCVAFPSPKEENGFINPIGDSLFGPLTISAPWLPDYGSFGIPLEPIHTWSMHSLGVSSGASICCD